jgi:mono/diheme cytochrome c family protein
LRSTRTGTRQSPTSNSNPRPRPPLRTALITLLAATAILTAGCGAVPHLTANAGDPARGKALFTGKGTCGSCHTLADAGAKGTIGPNLDEAFRYDKCQGFQLSTIRDVVRGQIAYATANPGTTDPVTGGPVTGMPDNLLRGQDAKDVAAYVAKVAGTGGCPTK